MSEEAPEVKETEVAVTFQNAPIKHIKAKTLKPFKKRFAKTLVMFYRAASLCGHCPAIKPKFALVADYVMQRTGGKDFSVGAVDCSQKGAPEALCDGIWATHPGVDGSAPVDPARRGVGRSALAEALEACGEHGVAADAWRRLGRENEAFRASREHLRATDPEAHAAWKADADGAARAALTLGGAAEGFVMTYFF